MDTKKEALDYIIKNKLINIVFQPIVSLRDGKVLGHEALSRMTIKNEIQNTEMLFTLASEYKCLWELELLCRTKALDSAYRFMRSPYNKKLFINVNPKTLHDENFKKGFTRDFLMKYEIEPNNVIFEITEKNMIKDMDAFRNTVKHYKSQNYEIALDDAGAGYSGLNLISDINPNYIKLDMKIIQGVDSNHLKTALVKGMVEISKASDISLIAEGIETCEQLKTLIGLGVQYGQGYYIQEPRECIREINKDVLKVIRDTNLKKNHSNQSVSNIYIKNLSNYTDSISSSEIVLNVYDIFKHDKELFGLCVVDNDKPVGIITKEKLALKLSGQYGFTLFHKKPISQLMDRDFLMVDYKTPISIVSSIAMARANDRLYDFIVIVEQGKYAGTVTVKDLLQKTTEIEVLDAKHQNPLTGLPGNIVIERKLTQCLENCVPYSAAYLDIDNFKSYNDVYGFEKGDLIIKLLADIIRSHFSDMFIGHVGGDDFVVILDKHVTKEYFDQMVKEFEIGALSYYNKKDIENRFITSEDRRGKKEKIPLMTLTVVVANNQNYNYKDVYELTENLAELKKTAKQEKTSLLKMTVI